MNDNHEIVMTGGAVKAAGIKDGKGILEGYGVVFSTPGPDAQRDLAGQYFTKSTYLGPRDGDGADVLFHHSLPIKGIEGFADHLFAPVKTTKDEIGLFSQVVLDMSNKYEAAVYKLGEAGKLGFSSGSASHMVRCEDDGEIKRWPIAEMSLTPTPCEPRARAQAIKALEAETGGEAIVAVADELKAIFETQEQAEEAYAYAADEANDLWHENYDLRNVQRQLVLTQLDYLNALRQSAQLGAL